ncbi:MAG TPA: guanosine monophosphate reductase [bacterium]|nr:guanosine monophosphate reductase [bacterium]
MKKYFGLIRSLDLALSFEDVLLIPQHSKINSRSEVNLSTILSPNLTLQIPLISTNMSTVTGVEMAVKMAELGGMGILPRFEKIDDQANKVAEVKKRLTRYSSKPNIAASIGIKENLERAKALVRAGASIINIDVAHGHMQQNLDFVKSVKSYFGDKITIIGGIVATGECARALFKAGADTVFVGIGGGSICTTRIQTGCGLPTFDSLLRVSKVAREMKKTYIAGAGIRNSGDIVKALAAGASAIAGGNIFAGTNEAPGKLVEVNGKKYKEYEGSTSVEAKTKHIEINPSEKSSTYIKHIEGVSGLIEYKGPVEEVVNGLLAGIRSGFSYNGAKNIQELWKRAKFVRITAQGAIEGGAHDLIRVE